MAVHHQFVQRNGNATGHRQRGVTLLVVMVMLVVIGLVSASAMRQAANADLISNNARMEHLANQGAETALRLFRSSNCCWAMSERRFGCCWAQSDSCC